MVASEEEARLLEHISRCTVTGRILEVLEGGEKSLSELMSSLNEMVPEPLDELVVRLFLSQLEMQGFIEKKDKGGEAAYTLTEKFKTLKAEKEKKSSS